MTKALNLLIDRRLRLTAGASIDELRADIVRAAYVEGDFLLTGGLRRNYYIDKYLFQTRPGILRRLARFIGEMVPHNTNRIAAPALGTVPLGTAVSLETGLPLVIVRAFPHHDTQRNLEGELYPGEDVVLIEDVVVTGQRALHAIKQITAIGARVTDIVAVLDRQEGAAKAFAEVSINYRHLFVPQDLGISVS